MACPKTSRASGRSYARRVGVVIRAPSQMGVVPDEAGHRVLQHIPLGSDGTAQEVCLSQTWVVVKW